MKKKKIIYIIYENANRELVGKLLLSAYALVKNYHIVIGEKNELRSIIKYLPAGIIIEKAMRKGSNKRFKIWKKLGHKIYSLDEEALMYHDNKIYLKQNIDDDISLFLNLFFLWSDKHKTMIKGKSYVMLLNHLDHKVVEVKSGDLTTLFEVTVLDKDKVYYKFNWTVEKYIKDGPLKDCWLTTMVSAPMPLGSSI